MPWPSPWLVRSGDLPADALGGLLVRVSAQRYNVIGQYEALGEALAEAVAGGGEASGRSPRGRRRG